MTVRCSPDGGIITGGCTRLGGGGDCADTVVLNAETQNDAHIRAAGKEKHKPRCFIAALLPDIALA
jgi:hypothetical protein